MSDLSPDLAHSETRFLNRESSWLKFNERVLSEATNPKNPLFEQLKFLAIFESNLDEFYMVRVSGLIEQAELGLMTLTPDGKTPRQQIEEIAKSVQKLRKKADDLWSKILSAELRANGYRILSTQEAKQDGLKELETYFLEHIFPICMPLMLDPFITFPFISNRSLNLAVDLDSVCPKLARVKIPPHHPRLIQVPSKPGTYVLIEDLIGCHLQSLFPGVDILGWHTFRVIRDADIEIREIEAADLIDAVEETLRLRRFGDPVLLEIDEGTPKHWIRHLRDNLKLDQEDVITVKGRIGYEFLWEMSQFDQPDLKFKPFKPHIHKAITPAEKLFETVKTRDILLHHPYDSFDPVEDLFEAAANDPQVIGIKATLYRVGPESPIVKSLLAAAEQGKQVAVMVELKARFDENNNLIWSRALERAGVHVTYGFREMKVHCKLGIVLRQEPTGLQTYVHIASGNYNPTTAKLYTDFGLFTSNDDICKDAIELFNFLTGYSHQSGYRQLMVAPLDLRDRIIENIRLETENHLKFGGGQIIFKLNSLVDPEVIDALYDASQAGVTVLLAVRGICCLRPGVKGLSERIQVVSVVGRFLEHSRAYYFRNNGDPELWIGSSDMMRRNLDRRIEVLAPLKDPCHIEYVRDEVLLRHFEPKSRAYWLQNDGSYKYTGQPDSFEIQTYLLNKPASLACP